MNDFLNNSAEGLDDVKDPFGHYPGDPTYIPKAPEPGKNPFYDAVDSGFKSVGSGIKSIFDFLTNAPQNIQNWLAEKTGLTNVKDSVNNATSQGKIAYTSSGIPYDETNIDSRINAEMQEYANKRDDEAYSRLIKQLKDNGINPVLALSNSASPFSSDSGYRSNYSLTDKDQINSALKAGSILALLLGLIMRK